MLTTTGTKRSQSARSVRHVRQSLVTTNRWCQWRWSTATETLSSNPRGYTTSGVRSSLKSTRGISCCPLCPSTNAASAQQLDEQRSQLEWNRKCVGSALYTCCETVSALPPGSALGCNRLQRLLIPPPSAAANTWPAPLSAATERLLRCQLSHAHKNTSIRTNIRTLFCFNKRSKKEIIMNSSRRLRKDWGTESRERF